MQLYSSQENANISVCSLITMPLSKSTQIAIIALVAILLVSAAALRLIPTGDSDPSHSSSSPQSLRSPQDLTDKSLASIQNSSTLFVLDFYYPGCGPCQLMNKTTSELSDELGGQVQFGRMNARSNENKNTVRDYKISAFPTLLFFQEGVLVSRMRGNISKSDLMEELKELQPGLDASRVLLPPADQTKEKPKATADTAAANPPQGEAIELIEPGPKNPSQAMLITDNTINSTISQYQPVLVLVGVMDSCGFCRLYNVTISELARELQGQAAFGLIDIRPNHDTRNRYNITAAPTTLIFKDGNLAGRMRGIQNKKTVAAKLKEIAPNLDTSKIALPPAPPRLTPEQVCANMTKSDQPLLQAFVVSRCPFGLQMQRIMADIISEAEETVEFLKVMYIGEVDAENNTIIAMHGEVEAQENLRQICIREEQPDRYWDYVRCYMKEGKTAECLESVSINLKELDACTNDSARGLAYAQEDFDLAGQFQISGSPTMLMNGEIVREANFATNDTNARSPEAVKELLCCGFEQEPPFCSMKLNGSRAASMFSS